MSTHACPQANPVRPHREPLKSEIIAAGTAPGEYVKAKTALVQELTDPARTERGLTSKPVWEKQ